MSQIVYDAEYEENLGAYFNSLLPEKIYDGHFHLNRSYTESKGYNGTPYEQYSEFTEKYLGRKLCGGLVMAQPSSKHTEDFLRITNISRLTTSRKVLLRSLKHLSCTGQAVRI